MTRNEFLRLLLAASVFRCAPALADDGGGDGGGGNSGPGGDGGGDNSGPGGGDGDDGGNDEDGDDGDHDKARKETEKGKAAKLKSILNAVKRRYPGEVVSVKYLGGSGAYRIKVLNGEGRLITISVDAASASILKVTGQ